jgi:hypothetical protein
MPNRIDETRNGSAGDRQSRLPVGFLLALAVGGLALRLAIAPWGGHPGDLGVLARWSLALNEGGWLGVYTHSDANYPPLGMGLIAAANAALRLLRPAASPLSPAWLVAVKLPAMLADLLIIGQVWGVAGDTKRARWLLVSIAFNPALIYLSAWWGQPESVYACLVLAAILAAGRGRSFRAGLWLGLGVMVKLQAAVAAPLILLIAATQPRQGEAHLPTLPEWLRIALPNVLKTGLGAAASIGAALAPFALSGQLKLVLQRSIALVASPGWLTVNALNVWYLLTGGRGNWTFNTPLSRPDTLILVGGVSAREIGLLALAIWSASVLWLGWRARFHDRLGGWLLAGALLYLGIFLFPTQAHERYAFPAVPLLAACVAVSSNKSTKVVWQHGVLYGMITIIHVLNLIWAAPFSPTLEAVFAGRVESGAAIALLMCGLSIGGWYSLMQNHKGAYPLLAEGSANARVNHPGHRAG